MVVVEKQNVRRVSVSEVGVPRMGTFIRNERRTT
jgi:hypothetical protein